MERAAYFLQERVAGLDGRPVEGLEDYLVGGACATVIPDEFSPDNVLCYGEKNEKEAEQ